MSVSTGDSPDHVEINRRRLVDALGFSTDQVVLGRLRHGNEVTVFRRTEAGVDGAGTVTSGGSVSYGRTSPRDGIVRYDRTFTSDAAVSDVPGLLLFVTFADCVPLLFWDRRRNVVGVAHAGWRGTAAAIGPAVIEAMQRCFGSSPTDITVGIGPSIGPCCYTVGQDVLQGFEAGGYAPVAYNQDGDIKLDLWASNERQLLAVGIVAGSIENSGICTSCHVDSYYSHRAEQGRTGRFALCAGVA
jgi:YfiH family protein